MFIYITTIAYAKLGAFLLDFLKINSLKTNLSDVRINYEIQYTKFCQWGKKGEDDHHSSNDQS